MFLHPPRARRILFACAPLVIFLVLFSSVPLVQAAVRAAVPLPPGLAFAGSSPEAVPEAFLRLPYRVDGAIDENGVYTTFADRSRRFSSPGLNCSGLVLGASRFLLGRNITLDEAVRDRHGDSGPGAPGGEDWDFGWDLILNISEGLPRRWLLPGMTVRDVDGSDAAAHAGYPIQDEETWRELPDRLLPGRLYLFSLMDYGRLKGYGLQHYHVGLALVSANGQAWFYQTTGKGGGVNRRDLKSAQGVKSFKSAFADNGRTKKSMLVLEVALPSAMPALSSAASPLAEKKP